MAKPKKKTTAVKPKAKAKPTKVEKPEDKKPRKDPRIEEIYEDTVSFMCPVRGLITQKVKIKRFKSFGEQAKHVLTGSEVVDKIEEQDDGLSIYSDGEELGVEG